MRRSDSQIVSIMQTLLIAVHMRTMENPDQVVKEVAGRLLKSGRYNNAQDQQALLVFKLDSARLVALNDGYAALEAQR